MIISIKKTIQRAVGTLFLMVLLLPSIKAFIKFLPFQGYRPHPSLADKIISPPYNFLSLQDAKDLAKNNPYSFLHISRPEVAITQEIAPYTNNTGMLGRKNLEYFIEQGWLVKEQHPAYYIYEQVKKNKKYRSILGLVAVQHYADNTIKQHENTVAEKEAALTQFTELEQAHIDPVVLMYQSNKAIDETIQHCSSSLPTQHFIGKDGSHHKLWAIHEPTIVRRLSKAFEQLSSLYIADGHHRSAAAFRLQQQHKSSDPYAAANPYNFFLAALIPDNHICLTSYNRIIKDLNGYSKKEFLERIATHFTVKKVISQGEAQPLQPHTFGMLLDNDWYHLTLKKLPSSLPKKNLLNTLDMTILNKTILEPLLEIKTLSNYNRIECVSGLAGLTKIKTTCKKKKWRLGFALCPLTTDTFIKVVEQNYLMPAKTTWFEPKMWQGLVIRTFN